MCTVKTLLENKFNEFVMNIKPIIPSIEEVIKNNVEEIDFLEVLELILFLFPDDDITFHLNQFLELKNIELSNEQKIDIIPFIEKYLIFLRKIKKLL